MDKADECRMPAGESLESAAELAFVAGDREAGLVVVGLGEAERTFRHAGQDIHVRLSAAVPEMDIRVQTLSLEMAHPVRFRIEWLIPEAARNAAMTLNDGLLISPFAAGWPDRGPKLPQPACGHQAPVSTLHPGQFQSLNFTWQDGDILALYLLMPA